MANYDYKRTLESLANMNLANQQLQRRPLPPASKNPPPPPPPYNSAMTPLPPYNYSKINNTSSSIGANAAIISNNQQQPEIKPKLPYNVKLSKVTGTSEAEKKLELLTRQLEKEMDEKEKQEYFGESYFTF